MGAGHCTSSGFADRKGILHTDFVSKGPSAVARGVVDNAFAIGRVEKCRRKAGKYGKKLFSFTTIPWKTVLNGESVIFIGT